MMMGAGRMTAPPRRHWSFKSYRYPRTFFACRTTFLPVCPKQTGAQSAIGRTGAVFLNPRAATYASAVPATACPLLANCT